MKEEFILVLITVPTFEEGEQIAEVLVEKQLAACCNIVKDINSIFRWKGEVSREKESLLLIKTVRKKLDDIIHQVRNMHSYQIPEIIALPIIGGFKDYLQWVKDESW